MDSSEIRDYTAQFGGVEDTPAKMERRMQEDRRRELLATTKITGWFALLLFFETFGGIVSFCLSAVVTFVNDLDSLVAHPLIGGTDILTVECAPVGKQDR